MSNLKTSLKVGLQILTVLAASENHRPVPVRELGDQLGQSEKYLEQLMLPLRRSRLVNSVRGPHGGYQLARTPDSITLAEVMELMQGPISFCDCLTRDCGDCVSPAIWQTLESVVASSLAQVTLKDLMTGRRTLVAPPALSPAWVRDGLGI
jgi:Rrf2 family protein